MAAREGLLGAITRRAGETPASVRNFGTFLTLALRAEADLAASARARRSEADLSEARSRGAGILQEMRALTEEVRAERPYYLAMAMASLALCEAEFARLEGRMEPDAWGAAVAAYEGQPYVRAYALMREGEAALIGPHDKPRAAAVLAEAHAIATRLRARPMLKLIETLATAAGTPKPAAESGREGSRGRFDLSPRELEVLQLLAAGRSDREIGDALFISKKTVSVHVANIRGKLGAQSRVEILTSAMAIGLVDAPSAGSS
jgi:DNA-binding CsgD family transcriptional regulator